MRAGITKAVAARQAEQQTEEWSRITQTAYEGHERVRTGRGRVDERRPYLNMRRSDFGGIAGETPGTVLGHHPVLVLANADAGTCPK